MPSPPPVPLTTTTTTTSPTVAIPRLSSSLAKSPPPSLPKRKPPGRQARETTGTRGDDGMWWNVMLAPWRMFITLLQYLHAWLTEKLEQTVSFLTWIEMQGGRLLSFLSSIIMKRQPNRNRRGKPRPTQNAQLYHMCASVKQFDALPFWGEVRHVLPWTPLEQILCRDEHGGTMLHLLCEKDAPVDVARLLVWRGVPIDEANLSGDRALHVALRNNANVDLIKMLLIEGADATCKDANGNTPLGLVVSCPHSSDIQKMTLIRLLLTHGAKLNAFDENGLTPLHIVANNPNTTSVLMRFMLARGCDPNLSCRPPHPDHNNNHNDELDKNKQPLHFACDCGMNVDAIATLISYGADSKAECISGASRCGCGKATTTPLRLAFRAPASSKAMIQILQCPPLPHKMLSRCTLCHMPRPRPCKVCLRDGQCCGERCECC